MTSAACAPSITLDGPSRTLDETELRQLTATLKQLPSALCVLDPHMRYLACTPSWRAQQQVEDVKLRGLSIYDIPHRFAFSTFCPQYFKRALAGETVGSLSERFETSDGQVEWISWSVSPYQHDGDEAVLGIVVAVEVVTRLKQLEQEIVDERARSVHSARLAALGEMAGGIAHELNNPMSILLSLVDELRDTVPSAVEDDALSEVVDGIEDTATRVVRIVSGLRNLTRDGAQDAFEPCDLAGIVEDTLALCEQKFRSRQVALRWSKPAAPVSAECQRVQIAQVLLNLLNNAYDAVAEQPERWVQIALQQTAQGTELSVTDSGAGIDPAIADKIMAPFFTTKPPGQGTGLGLSISRRIMQNHNGDLRLSTDSPHTQLVMLIGPPPP